MRFNPVPSSICLSSSIYSDDARGQPTTICFIRTHVSRAGFYGDDHKSGFQNPLSTPGDPGFPLRRKKKKTIALRSAPKFLRVVKPPFFLSSSFSSNPPTRCVNTCHGRKKNLPPSRGATSNELRGGGASDNFHFKTEEEEEEGPTLTIAPLLFY